MDSSIPSHPAHLLQDSPDLKWPNLGKVVRVPRLLQALVNRSYLCIESACRDQHNYRQVLCLRTTSLICSSLLVERSVYVQRFGKGIVWHWRSSGYRYLFTFYVWPSALALIWTWLFGFGINLAHWYCTFGRSLDQLACIWKDLCWENKSIRNQVRN